jgi:hypothetical protein
MSLLDVGRETVTVYHDEVFTSPDGNIMHRPSTTDVDVIDNCAVQVAAQSGTSARRAEQDEEGYNTEEVYRFRPPRSYTRRIGFNAQALWRGKRWAIIGMPKEFNGSDNTFHTDYTLRRT